MRNTYFNFVPDLVVEATSVCDRSCAGCYAPNVVSTDDAQELLEQKPNLFIKQEALNRALSEIEKPRDAKIRLIAVRGGEPTRHPQIAELLRVTAKFCSQLFLETHGRWILSKDEFSKLVLDECFRLGVVIKLSFDKMHGGTNVPLRAMTTKLDELGIQYLIAITESTDAEFQLTRGLCDWVDDSKIIFQKKARKIEDLILPQIGVVRVDGSLARSLNARSIMAESISTQKVGVVA